MKGTRINDKTQLGSAYASPTFQQDKVYDIDMLTGMWYKKNLKGFASYDIEFELSPNTMIMNIQLRPKGKDLVIGRHVYVGNFRSTDYSRNVDDNGLIISSPTYQYYSYSNMKGINALQYDPLFYYNKAYNDDELTAVFFGAGYIWNETPKLVNKNIKKEFFGPNWTEDVFENDFL